MDWLIETCRIQLCYHAFRGPGGVFTRLGPLPISEVIKPPLRLQRSSHVTKTPVSDHLGWGSGDSAPGSQFENADGTTALRIRCRSFPLPEPTLHKIIECRGSRHITPTKLPIAMRQITNAHVAVTSLNPRDEFLPLAIFGTLVEHGVHAPGCRCCPGLPTRRSTAPRVLPVRLYAHACILDTSKALAALPPMPTGAKPEVTSEGTPQLGSDENDPAQK